MNMLDAFRETVISIREWAEVRFDEINSKIDELHYNPIEIILFGPNKSTSEIGSTIDTVTLSWKIDRLPTELTISALPDGVEPELSQAGSVDVYNISSTSTWTLTVVGDRGETAKETASINFYNGVYYGAAAEPETYDSNFILGLTRELRSNKKTSINVTAGDGQYIYYCLPTRYGECKFKLGGFDGGFEPARIIDFENDSGYEEPYYIYRSSYAALGTPTITIA